MQNIQKYTSISCKDYNKEYLDKFITSTRYSIKTQENLRSLILNNYVDYEGRDQNLPMDKRWIVGFTDGEGYFSYNVAKSIKYTYGIKLHSNDELVLKKIRDNLNINANVLLGHKKNDLYTSALLKTSKLQVIYEAIIPLFKKYSLLTKKNSDFLLWCNSIEYWWKVRETYTNQDVINASIYKEYLNKKAHKIIPYPTISEIRSQMSLPWIVGFIEGEGSFSIVSKLSPKFSIFQNSTSYNCLRVLLDTLIALPSDTGCPYEVDPTPDTLHPYSKGYKITVTHIEFIYWKLIPYLISTNWHARKSVDLVLWIILVHYLKRGLNKSRSCLQIINDIGLNNNQRRYFKKDRLNIDYLIKPLTTPAIYPINLHNKYNTKHFTNKWFD